MFACKFCENFKTTFFTEYLRWLLLDKQGDWYKHEHIRFFVNFRDT